MSTPTTIERLVDVDLPKVKYSTPMLGIGVTGTVYPIDDDTVVKLSMSSEYTWDSNRELQDIWTERMIYKRLGSHPRVCRYIRDVDRGIVLERLGDSLRKHLFLLQKDGKVPPPAKALKWSIQAAEALAYIHTKSVIQADVGCYNFLLDSNEDLKICDFGGSSIDGCVPKVGYGTRSQLWRDPNDETASIPCELFALGSTIYEIWTTRQPYHDLEDNEVEERYKNQQFPELGHMPVAEVIQKCWLQKYTSASEVVRDLQRLENLWKPTDTFPNEKATPPTTETDTDTNADPYVPSLNVGPVLATLTVIASIVVLAKLFRSTPRIALPCHWARS